MRFYLTESGLHVYEAYTAKIFSNIDKIKICFFDIIF